MYFLGCTLSRELPLSLCFSGRLLPESVLMSEPRESAWRTELMLGVDDVWGEAVRTQRSSFILIRKCLGLFYYIFFSIVFHSQVPEMTPKTSLCKLVSRKVLDLGGVIKALVRCESSLPFWRNTSATVKWTQTHILYGAIGTYEKPLSVCEGPLGPKCSGQRCSSPIW